MTFDEWFKITIKSDFKIATNEIYPRDIVGMEHLKRWIKLIYNAGWNDGRGSKETRDILSSFISDLKKNH